MSGSVRVPIVLPARVRATVRKTRIVALERSIIRAKAMLTIRLFGPPQVRVNGEPIPRPKTRKGLWLLALLALRHGREVERAWLAGTLWPENEDSQALTYLRQALTDLRHALGPDAARLLSPSSRTLSLDVAGADADVVTFDDCLKRGDGPSLE